MKIKNVYRQYRIPPNLQEHLLRVTKIALFICKHWTGPQINKDLIRKSALLHDLGNIVKFDLERYPISKEKAKADFWLKVKKDFVDKYGSDDHQATLVMLEELGINSKIAKVIKAKSLANALKIANSKNWEVKILFYADLRVGPFGLLSLEERLNEVLPRLGYQRLDNLDKLVAACYQIEKQIGKNLDIDINEISNESINKLGTDLLETRI